jgi:prolyl 4-hydroxylase
MNTMNFIDITPLDDINLCDELIDFFHRHKTLQTSGYVNLSGIMPSVVNKEFKDSTDLNILWEVSETDETIKKYQEQVIKLVIKYGNKYECMQSLNMGFTDSFNIQSYKPKGGYKAWHFERSQNTQERVFAFMTYLNDVPDGGTEFYYQETTTKAKKGDTVIWPTEWTHTHKSQVSKKHEKYIATGWLELKKEEIRTE